MGNLNKPEAAERTKSGIELLIGGEATRLGLLDSIGTARSSCVITYFTSVRPGYSSHVDDRDVRVLESHIRKAKAAGAKSIDLFLCTAGGVATFPWEFVAMLREHMPSAKFGVIIPYWAYSAGTATALGADEIVMTPSGVLGPVDSQIYRPRMELVVNSRLVGSFLELIEDVGAKQSRKGANLQDLLTQNADPLLLGALHRAAKEDDRLIDNMLASRQSSLPARDVKRIKRFFLDEVALHSQGIRRTEARKAGLSFITNSEATGVHSAIETLFEHYASAMKLFHPFASFEDPDDEHWGGHFDAYGQHSAQTPIVVIESQYDCNPAFSAYGSDRHWDAPPPVGSGPSKTPVQTAPGPSDYMAQPNRMSLSFTNRSGLTAMLGSDEG